MNEELLADSALFVQSGTLLVDINNGLTNFLQLSKTALVKPAVPVPLHPSVEND
jgi:hypothetical protein